MITTIGEQLISDSIILAELDTSMDDEYWLCERNRSTLSVAKGNIFSSSGLVFEVKLAGMAVRVTRPRDNGDWTLCSPCFVARGDTLQATYKNCLGGGHTH